MEGPIPSKLPERGGDPQEHNLYSVQIPVCDNFFHLELCPLRGRSGGQPFCAMHFNYYRVPMPLLIALAFLALFFVRIAALRALVNPL